MNDRASRWIAFVALAAAIVPILFLAGGLGGTEFSDGRPFDERDPARLLIESGGVATPPRSLDLWLAYAPIGLLLLSLGVYVAVKGRGSQGSARRRNVATLVGLALIMIALAWVARDRMLENLKREAAAPAEAVLEEEQNSRVSDSWPAPPEIPPSTASGDARATSLLLQSFFAVVAIAASVGLVVAISRLRARRPVVVPPSSTDGLLVPVEAALDRLRQGRDAAGVVEECYRDMMVALARALGLNPRAMTPREFACAAAAVGLGGAAVDELTELFELVRYGSRPDAPMAPRALHCMTRLRDVLAAAGTGG